MGDADAAAGRGSEVRGLFRPESPKQPTGAILLAHDRSGAALAWCHTWCGTSIEENRQMAKAIRARSRTRATKSRAAETAAINTPGTKRGASKTTMTKKKAKRSAAPRIMGVTIPKT